jgi:hypothetical protein
LITGIFIMMVVFGSVIDRISKLNSRFSRSMEMVFPMAYMILLIGVIVWYNYATTTVFIVNSRTDHSQRYLIGSHTYSFKNGNEVVLKSSLRNNIVINNSDSVLHGTEQHYSKSGYDFNPNDRVNEQYPPLSAKYINHTVDYYPDESFPSSISTRFSFRYSRVKLEFERY